MRAQLAGDFAGHRRLLERLDLHGADGRGYLNLIEAGFFEAVDRRFGTSGTHADVVQFVADLRSRNDAAADAVHPQVAERMILHSLGKGSLAHVDDEAKLDTQMFVLPVLIAEERLDDAGLDAFMDRARATADRWLTKDEAGGGS